MTDPPTLYVHCLSLQHEPGLLPPEPELPRKTAEEYCAQGSCELGCREGHHAAQMHALAARRAGASWEELHKVVELAAATRALMPANQGFAMLNTLRKQDGGG